jgi:hypothetical protein
MYYNIGMLKGFKGVSLVLEAVAASDLWIWHAFFGMPGSLNDINVFNRSPLQFALINGTMHGVNFEVNGRPCGLPYWLADGIYPDWPIFMKTITNPDTAARRHFAKLQESLRKDIERAFGVLQARFAIVKNPALMWSSEKLHTIMSCCIILHNMIIEDERELDASDNDLEFHDPEPAGTAERRWKAVRSRHTRIKVSDNRQLLQKADGSPRNTIAAACERIDAFTDAYGYHRLRNDLVCHLWSLRGNRD